MDGMPHGTNVSDPVYHQYTMIERTRKAISAEIDDCSRQIAALKEFEHVIGQLVVGLPNRARRIIVMRYQKGFTMAYIANMCEVAERTAYNYETAAVQQIADQIVKNKDIAETCRRYVL